MSTEVTFLRHAQGWHNVVSNDYNGDFANDPLFRDAELTPAGLEQCAARRDEFSKMDFDVIYCSPMRRCRQTLLGVYPKADELNVYVDDRLIEQPTGTCSCNHRLERDEMTCSKKWDLSGVSLVNPFNTVCDVNDKRKISSFTEMIKEKHKGKKVLVVSHGTWIYRWTEMYSINVVVLKNCAYARANIV